MSKKDAMTLAVSMLFLLALALLASVTVEAMGYTSHLAKTLAQVVAISVVGIIFSIWLYWPRKANK